LVNCELIRAFPLTCHLPGEAGSGPHLILLSGVEIRRVVTEQAKLRGGGLSTLGLQLPDFLVILEGDGYIAQSPPPLSPFPRICNTHKQTIILPFPNYDSGNSFWLLNPQFPLLKPVLVVPCKVMRIKGNELGYPRDPACDLVHSRCSKSSGYY
jgi:hypothetical protein